MTSEFVQVWQRLLQFDRQPWVAFENGTCVALADPADNVEARAQAILAAYGSAGTAAAPAGMRVVTPYEMPGWVVRGPDPNVLVYVHFEEAGGPDAKHEDVAKVGFAKIAKDAETLKFIHVEMPR
jgi:hypothetical protein